MTHRIILARVTLVCMLCLSASAAVLQQGNSIHGKVRNAAGKNMAQVIVEIETGNGQLFETTVTNNEGDFSITGLTGTSYIVVIRQLDYEPLSEHVDFVRTVDADAPGERRTLQITLVPKGGVAALPSNRVVTGQSVPKAARDALERALKFAKDNKSEDTIASLKEAIKAYPDYFDAHLLLAGEYLKADRLDESIAEYEQARKINPKDDRVYQGFGQVLMKQKKFALAAGVFGEAARLNPSDANIQMVMGMALLEHASVANPAQSKEAAAEREKSFGLAETAFLKAFELSGKKMAAVHLQLARLYEKKGKRAKAADELEQYLKMSPGDKKADALREAIKTLRAGDGR
jgi:Tfp pilus assembly protein PilF